MHIDVGPHSDSTRDGLSLDIRGAARDVDPSGVIAYASIEAILDPTRVLVELNTTPDTAAVAWAREMVGQRSGSGFRRRLAEIAPDTDRARPETDAAASLVRQLLEDLPAAALISGYASLRLARRTGGDPGRLTPPSVLDRMTDICSGWRAGGIAAASIGAGHGVPVQITPPAPDLAYADRRTWHEIPDLPHDWMRRRRLIHVTFGTAPDGESGAPGPPTDRADLWAMFRDTVGEPNGKEAVLHEYALTATLAPVGAERGATASRGTSGFVVESIEADPRVLPFAECPAAASHVAAIAGTRIDDLPSVVPDVLTSVSSCTHLNDLLRSIGGVTDLLAPAARRLG